MKKLLPALSIILCTTGLFCNTLFAQQYTVSSIPYNPVPYDSGIAVVSPVDDLWGQVLGIGFDFNFFGQNKQTLIVGTNGIITFDSSLANMQCPWYITPANTLPSTTLPNTIMFPYQDVDISLGGTVRHQVFGSPPNRRFVVSFDSVPYYDNSQGACGPNFPPFTGQVILYEGSNNIDMFIQDKGTCTGWNGGLAIMGIQNANGTEAYTVPGRNNTVWSANNEGWRFTNSNLPAQTPIASVAACLPMVTATALLMAAITACAINRLFFTTTAPVQIHTFIPICWAITANWQIPVAIPLQPPILPILITLPIALWQAAIP